jgi:hypothetical protein
MANVIGGAGLPIPAFLYPSEVFNAPVDVPTARIAFPGGSTIPLPTGSNMYFFDLGTYSVWQYFDPVMGCWRAFSTERQGHIQASSNGLDFRIANMTGCPIAAVVAGGGSGFTQSTAAITANVGGSTWQPIVGGQLSVSTINAAGAGYTMPPLLLIPGPPAKVSNGVGGVPATGYCTLTGTSVTGVTLTNLGAGYTVAPTAPQGAIIVPNPADPNLGAITNATVTLVKVAATADAITAALCTNNGAPLATLSALTLTAAGGAGTGATITPQVLRTITATSIAAGGVAWGTATAFAKIMSAGGYSTPTPASLNPTADLTTLRIRPAEGVGTTNAGGTITAVTLNDPGLFLSNPTAAFASGGPIPTTAASVVFTTGAGIDSVILQPL